MKQSLIILGLLTLALSFIAPGNAAKPQPAPDSAEKVKPLKVGSAVPPLSLQTIDGKSFNLNQAIGQKPTVLVFYRGGWCMYCNQHFSDLRKIEKPLKALGYQIIGISPDKPEKLKATLAKHKMSYTLLSDAPATAIRSFGLAFKVYEETVRLYKNKYGIDLEADSGHTHHLLPVPAVYILNPKGIVQWVYYNPDYKVRADGEKVLKAAQRVLRK